MYKLLFRFILLLIIGFSLIQCKDDPEIIPEVKEATDVNKFIYEGLSTYYLWLDKVDKLTDTRYKDKDTLNAFLNKYEDPEELFYDLLYDYGNVDKWSFIVDDSKEIDDWLAGISESMGFDFKLYYISENSENLVGVVRYVYKDSPADTAGLQRGDLFLKIDGQQLTLQNYQTLLFTKLTYTMGMASYTNGNFIANGNSRKMTAVLLQENPIHLDTVFTVNGIKVGYLVYNGFNASFDSKINTTYDIALNNVFGKFKAAGIEKLIIDLRYNGGGSVQSTIYLASMIHSTDPSKVFIKTRYNNILQTYYLERYGNAVFNDYFTNTISKTDKTPDTPINSLGLRQLYVITTSETASASELLINGLRPYMEVRQVGSNTTGKYVGSWTLKDYLDDEGTIVNPNNPWAMQPITFKSANADGISDFTNGLTPNVTAREYATDLLPFGDPTEDMLKACLNDIQGIKSARVYPGPDIKGFKSSDDFSPHSRTMYRDQKLPFPKIK